MGSSPKSSTREPLQKKSPGLPTPTDFEVRNTFIHFESAPADERAVQSMPHGMFGQCLWAETLSEQAAERAPVSSAKPFPMAAPMPFVTATGTVAEDRVLEAGTEVLISGLMKCPAFNGLSGTVQSLDVESGRYDVLLTLPAGGNKWAKVKRENLQLASPAPPPCYAPRLVLEEAAEEQSVCAGLANLPSTPMWEEYRPQLQSLALSALV